MKKATRMWPLPNRIKKYYTRTVSYSRRYIDTHPLRSFFIVLGAVLVLIVISNLITNRKSAVPIQTKSIKTVSVYRIGAAPQITVAAQTKKSGVIQITALTNGVINTIYK